MRYVAEVVKVPPPIDVPDTERPESITLFYLHDLPDHEHVWAGLWLMVG